MGRIKKIVFIIIAATISYRGSAFSLVIDNQNTDTAKLEKLFHNFNRANEFFQKEIIKSDREIRVVIDSKECFRTGYNYQKNEINFCKNKNVKNLGLNSDDVITHELFHAFFCNSFNDLCQEKTIRAEIHEGLADYFSYLLNPDSHFGEDFYINQAYIRDYLVYWRWDLVETPHQLGNVLSSELIKSQFKLKNFIELFSKPLEKGLTVFVSTNGIEEVESKLSRYRLELNQKKDFNIQFNSADAKEENWRVVIENQNENLKFQLSGAQTFSVIPVADFPPSKITMIIFNDLSIEIGRKSFYFIMKKN